MNIQHPGLLWRVIDTLLWPVMFLVGGCRRSALQHTHAWHMQNASGFVVDHTLAARVAGSDSSSLQRKGILFHIPLLGGWRDYAVLEAEYVSGHWHVAWQLGDATIQVHRLPIKITQVRVLVGPAGAQTTFFALTDDGQQLPLRAVATGRLGDGQYRRVPLY